jgi:hypothetical protein
MPCPSVSTILIFLYICVYYTNILGSISFASSHRAALNYCMLYLPPNSHIFIISTTLRLNIPQRHDLALEIRGPRVIAHPSHCKFIKSNHDVSDGIRES